VRNDTGLDSDTVVSEHLLGVNFEEKGGGKS